MTRGHFFLSNVLHTCWEGHPTQLTNQINIISLLHNYRPQTIGIKMLCFIIPHALCE